MSADILTRVGWDTSPAEAGQKKLIQLADGYAKKAIQAGAAADRGLLGGLGDGLKGKLLGLGAGVVGLGVLKSTFDEFGRIGDLAARLDTSAESIQRVGNVAKLSGTDVETAVGALTRLHRNLAAGDPGIAKAFNTLGINISNFLTLDPDQQLIALAGAFQQAQQSGKGFAEVFDAIGSSASELLPLLRTSRSEMEEIAGIQVVSDENISRIAALGDAYDQSLSQTKAGVASAAIETGKWLGLLTQAVVQADSLLSIGDKFTQLSDGIADAEKTDRAKAKDEREQRRTATADEEKRKKKEKDDALDAEKVKAKKSKEFETRQEVSERLLLMGAKATGDQELVDKVERDQKINAEKKRLVDGGMPVDEALKAATLQAELEEKAAGKSSRDGKIHGARSPKSKTLEEHKADMAKPIDKPNTPGLDRLEKLNERVKDDKLPPGVIKRVVPIGEGFKDRNGGPGDVIARQITRALNQAKRDREQPDNKRLEYLTERVVGVLEQRLRFAN